MKCKAEFIFKSLEKKEGGTFVNDKGDSINYGPRYLLQVDEVSESGKIGERIFRVNVNNTVLISKLREVDSYSPIVLFFDIVLYRDGCRIDVLDVSLLEQDKSHTK